MDAIVTPLPRQTQTALVRTNALLAAIYDDLARAGITDAGAAHEQPVLARLAEHVEEMRTLIRPHLADRVTGRVEEARQHARVLAGRA